MITIRIEEKEYNFPTSWEEVSMKLGRQLMVIEETNLFTKYVESIKIIHPELSELIYSFDTESFNELVDAIRFLEIEPTKIKNEIIEIDGVKYAMAKDVKDISVGEWVDLESILTDKENVINNLHLVVGIICREVVGEYEEFGKHKWTIEKYNGKKALERAEFFNEKMNVVDGLSICNFFLILEQMYIANMMNSLKPKEKKV